MSNIQVLSDRQWESIRPYVEVRRQEERGRPRVNARAALDAILHVLLTGTPWNDLPAGIGCSPSTARRTYKRWVEDETWGLVWSIYAASLRDELNGVLTMLDWFESMARRQVMVVKIGTGATIPADEPWWA